MKLLTQAQYAQLLKHGRQQAAVREAGKPEIDFHPVVKLFTPDGGATWLLTEIDPDDPDIAFGLCDLGLGFPEIGSVSLSELEALTMVLTINGRQTNGRIRAVERDLHFRATKPLSVYAEEAAKRGVVQVCESPRVF